MRRNDLLVVAFATMPLFAHAADPEWKCLWVPSFKPGDQLVKWCDDAGKPLLECYRIDRHGKVESPTPWIKVERSQASKIMAARQGACPGLPDGSTPPITLRGDG